jgi:peroxiredoxin
MVRGTHWLAWVVSYDFSNKWTTIMRAFLGGVLTLALAVGCNSTQGDLDSTASTAGAGSETNGSIENGSEANAEQQTKQLEVGDAAPAFENLEGVDGEQHALADYKDAKAVAIVFTCNHCPVAKAYEDRLMALDNDYDNADLAIVAINVNNIEADKLPAMKERAEEKGFEFDYLYDPSQQVGRDYQATVTPHAFLLDSERKLVYKGAIDDSKDEAKVSETYLRDAIDAVLAGETPEQTSVKPIGCGIQYE